MFEKPLTRTLLALFVVAMWALPFSLIKLGMTEFGIESGNVPNQTLYAGVRFLTAGILVLLGCVTAKRDLRVRKAPKGVAIVILFGLVNIGLHYFFFYSGVGVSPGGRSSVIYSCETFILIIASCCVFADDKMSARKALGCIVGLFGICLVNLDFTHPEELLSGMSLAGDGVLVLAAICGATGGMLTRIVTRYADTFAATGYSLAIGGAVLTILGLMLGGTFPMVTPAGIAILAILVFISAAAFAIYNKLISCNPVSTIAIFSSCIPVMGLIFACLILGEPFQIEYAIAAAMSAVGVILVNTSN